MQQLSRQWQAQGRTIAVVPTMGALHDGHLSLIKKAREYADKVVVTLFVNPTQFGAGEDLNNYPRTFENDCKICENEGTAAIFFPSAAEMYAADSSTWVNEEKVSQGFCAAARPTHFRGVTSVVTKLFNAVLPHVAVFGEKDYQQLQVLRRMVRDLNFPIEVIGAAIYREASGLAMSSRNRYLSDEERQSASIIYKSLQEVRQKLTSKSISLAEARDFIKKEITAVGGVVDYVETVNAENLQKSDECSARIRCLIAAHFGQARLLDNMDIYRD